MAWPTGSFSTQKGGCSNSVLIQRDVDAEAKVLEILDSRTFEFIMKNQLCPKCHIVRNKLLDIIENIEKDKGIITTNNMAFLSFCSEYIKKTSCKRRVPQNSKSEDTFGLNNSNESFLVDECTQVCTGPTSNDLNKIPDSQVITTVEHSTPNNENEEIETINNHIKQTTSSTTHQLQQSCQVDSVITFLQSLNDKVIATYDNKIMSGDKQMVSTLFTEEYKSIFSQSSEDTNSVKIVQIEDIITQAVTVSKDPHEEMEFSVSKGGSEHQILENVYLRPTGSKMVNTDIMNLSNTENTKSSIGEVQYSNERACSPDIFSCPSSFRDLGKDILNVNFGKIHKLEIMPLYSTDLFPIPSEDIPLNKKKHGYYEKLDNLEEF